MLRTLALLLVLANLAYFGWSQGMLDGLGLGPTQQREPQRIAGQISAGSVRVLNPEEARRVEAALAAQSAKRECLAAGPFNVAEADRLEQRLRTLLPPNAYTMTSITEPAQWTIYMGPYANADLMTRKQTELKGLGVKSEPIRNGALQHGLSLGGAATQRDAQAKLQALAPRGVRTARLVQEKPETVMRYLRVPGADEAQRRTVTEVLASPTESRPPRPC